MPGKRGVTLSGLDPMTGHMSCSLTSLKGESYRGLYRGPLEGLLMWILGVETVAHRGLGFRV